MFNLHVVQAAFGDCVLLEAGSPDDRTYVLVDGGPSSTFENHLKETLTRIEGDRIRLAVLSHVDTDHVVGLLDLMADLRSQRANGEDELIHIDEIWINHFRQTIGAQTDIEPRMQAIFSQAQTAGAGMALTGLAVNGIRHGNQLRIASVALGVPINEAFPDGVVSVDSAPRTVEVGSLKLTITGPTEANLDTLRAEWLEWLEENEDEPVGPALAARADRSIPNLSSITFVASADGKSVLMTGDGRGDHLIEGLKAAGLMASDGTFHVDVLKLPHHGSARNVDEEFFGTITADVYLISADGRHGNPDFETLGWLAKAARDQGRQIEILATNHSESTDKLLQDLKPDDFGYSMRFLEPGAHSLVLKLA